MRAHTSLMYFKNIQDNFFCLFVCWATNDTEPKQKKITKFHIEAIADSLSQLIMSNGILVQLDYLTRHQQTEVGLNNFGYAILIELNLLIGANKNMSK